MLTRLEKGLNMSPKLLYRGSVKDIYEIDESNLLFRFSDRYSIFDWGQMPDLIPGKGEALAQMGIFLLQFLKSKGIETHFLKEGKEKNEFIVNKVVVPRGNEGIYRDRPKNTLIPLEVIYRFGVPKGSSLLKRYQTKEAWLEAGFDRSYQEGEMFSDIKIDFTTKLERLDRPLSFADARALCGANENEWSGLVFSVQRIASILKERFFSRGIELWDGKLEFAYGTDRQIVLVDSIGLDEMRVSYEGQALSKELLRQFYLNSKWYADLVLAKAKFGEGFKAHCLEELKSEPESLPEGLVGAMSAVYQNVNLLLMSEGLHEIEEAKQKLKKALFILRSAS